MVERNNMKKWYVIDDCTTKRASIYETELKAETKEQAIDEAASIWESFTDGDKADRDEFYIIHAEKTEDGCIDYDSSDGYQNMKGAR